MAIPSKKRHQAGFTLTELMVTVIVIGILAAIAIPAYSRYARDVKTQEARTTLPQIRLKQQAYYLEFREYRSTTINPVNLPCGGSQEKWDATQVTWKQLGFRPATPGTYFQYFVAAGKSGTAVSEKCVDLILSTLHYPTGGDWFVACAYGNLIGSSCGSVGTSNKAFIRFGMSGSEQFNRVLSSDNTK